MDFELYALISLVALFFIAIPLLIFLSFDDKQY